MEPTQRPLQRQGKLKAVTQLMAAQWQVSASLASGPSHLHDSEVALAAIMRHQSRGRQHRWLRLLLLMPLLAATTRHWMTLWGFVLASTQQSPIPMQHGFVHGQKLRPLRAFSKECRCFTQRLASSHSSGSSSSGSDNLGPGGLYGMPQATGADAAAQQDAMKLFQQMLSGEAPPGAAAGPAGGFGGASGGQNAADPLAALLGGGGLGGKKKQKATDAFFTDRIPILQKVKRPILICFFAYCFYRGWIGRWGLAQGCISNSYFAMLAVPARVDPRSPFCGRPFFVAQLWVDYATKALGFLINLARGKTKIPTMADLKAKLEQQQAPMQSDPLQQQDQSFGGMGSPWNPASTQPYAPAAPGMPTAPTTTVMAEPLQSGLPFQAVPQEDPAPPPPRPPSPRQPPPVVDAEVRFLD